MFFFLADFVLFSDKYERILLLLVFWQVWLFKFIINRRTHTLTLGRRRRRHARLQRQRQLIVVRILHLLTPVRQIPQNAHAILDDLVANVRLLDGRAHHIQQRLHQPVAVAQLRARILAGRRDVAQHAARIAEHIRPARVARTVPIPAGVRYNDVRDNDGDAVIDDGALQVLARGHVPHDAGDQLLDVRFGGAAEQADEGADAAGVLDGALVLVVLAAVGEVAQGAARVAVDLAARGSQRKVVICKYSLDFGYEKSARV